MAGGRRCRTSATLRRDRLQQFYADRQPPPEVHTPVELPADEREAMEAWLSERAGRRVRSCSAASAASGADCWTWPRATPRSPIRRTSATAATSAFDALETLRATLALPALPRRIECFDISTFQGAGNRGVHGRGGRWPDAESAEYRKFTHQTRAAPTISPSMHEVVLRRYQRALEQGGPFPDLIVIDGGKGQLSAAYAALREVGLDRLVAIGLAKEEELIFTRDRAEGLALPRESPALRLLQRIRDEAHRFAVTFHRAVAREARLSRPCWTTSPASGRAAASSC